MKLFNLRLQKNQNNAKLLYKRTLNLQVDRTICIQKVPYLHTRSFALTRVLVAGGGGGGVATGTGFFAGGGVFLVSGKLFKIFAPLVVIGLLLVAICVLVGVTVFGEGGGGRFLEGVDLVCRPDLVVIGGVAVTGAGAGGGGGELRPPAAPRLVLILVGLLADVVGVACRFCAT